MNSLNRLLFLAVAAIIFFTFTSQVKADEFIGPLAGWSNVKTGYGARGDGKTDDTLAIQSALNDLGTSGHSNILYIPSGTYLISSTLTAHAKSGISILGEDPTTTTIKWIGPAGGTMVSINGVWYSRYGRITWDGSSSAQTIWYDWWDGHDEYFPTHNEHADEVFENCAYGLRGGQHLPGSGANTGDAEMAILRCKFVNCAKAGISVQDFNSLDWFAWYCLFDHCALGISNMAAPDGAGNFCVYSSVFKNSSVSDASIGNTGYFSFRNNYSIGSKAFFTASWSGTNVAAVTIQHNTILDTTGPSISVPNAGPVMLIDNVLRQAPGVGGPIIYVGVGTGTTPPNQDDTISVGNTFAMNQPASSPPILATGRVHSTEDRIIGRDAVQVEEPVLPPALPNLHRTIIELAGACDGADIQRAIDQAATLKGQRPVVHIPAGVHTVATTITVPPNCDVQIVGDGMMSGTDLLPSGIGPSAVLLLKSPSRATVRDLAVRTSSGNNGIVIGVADKPGDRVYIEQGDVIGASKNGLLVDGLGNTNVELHDFYHNQIDGAGVSVIGSTASATNSQPAGRCDLFGGESANEGTAYSVHQNGRLMAQDIWYEAHPTIQTFLNFNGSGTFTLQGAHGSAVTSPSVPAVNIGGYNGSISLIGVLISRNDSNAPFISQIGSTTPSSTRILLLGVFGDGPNWLSNQSPAQTAILSCKSEVPGGASMLYPETRPSDPNFVTSMLAQTRTEYPSVWPLAPTPAGTSDVRLYRIRVGDAPGADDIELVKQPE